MVLSYRTIFDVSEPDALRKIIEPAFHVWLNNRKGIDLDHLSANWSHGKGCRATRVTTEINQGKGQVSRTVLEDDTGYITTLTLTSRTSERVRFWLDIDSPANGAPAKPPQLVRSILSQVDATDGKSSMPDEPRLYQPHDVANLADQINDDQRLFPILVAGSASSIPLDAWRRYVTAITRDTCGMANLVLLSPEATRAFEQNHGEALNHVPVGTLRTFVPGIRLDDASASTKNKILGTERLVSDSTEYLARVLAGVARRSATGTALTRTEREAERALSRVTAEELLGFEKSLSPATPATGVGVAFTPAKPKFARSKTDPALQLVGPAKSIGVGLVNRLIQLVVHAYRDKWGRGDFGPQAIGLIELALRRDPESVRKSQEEVLTRIEVQQAQLESAQLQLAATKHEMSELDLDLAAAREDLVKAQGRVRHLEKLFVVKGLGEDAFTEPVFDVRTKVPTSFAEVVERVSDFSHITFTCDWDTVAGLDDTIHAPVSRLGGVWEGLIALDDYARSKFKGDFSGSFHEYLRNTPAGYSSLSTDRYAATESETVQQTPKYRQKRAFKVPAQIDESGTAIMFSHLKKGVETTDPRVYFHDATAKNNLIIVGYIGPHLEVKRTN